MYVLTLTSFNNLRFILTNKYLIVITKNGILKFKTNFYNLFIKNNKLYINLYQYSLFHRNFEYFFSNKLFLSLKNQCYVRLSNYYITYLQSLYSALYSISYPYTITLILKGVGYKFMLKDNILKIRIGYSHFIEYNLCSEIYLNLKNQTTLILYSTDNMLLTQLAAFFKLQKKINLYKGTGMFYIKEVLANKKKNNNKNKNAK